MSYDNDNTTLDCVNEIQHEINIYWGFVDLSLGLTIINIFVRNYMQSPQVTHPKSKYRPVSRLFIISGIIKCFIGVLLVTILLPRCPNDCTCNQIQIGHFSYGYFALALGVLWLQQGYSYHLKAQEAVQYVTSQDGIIMGLFGYE